MLSSSISILEKRKSITDFVAVPPINDQMSLLESKFAFISGLLNNDQKEAEETRSFLAESDYVLKNAKKISQTKNLLFDIKDKIRRNRHKGYIPESTNRNKFIVQNFIPDLNNDWKVLVFFDKCFILKRTIKPGDFRASGSGYQYKFDVKAEFPQGIFDFCIDYKNKLNVPNISLDVAFDGKEFFIIEFQALYFGTTTQEKSKYFFQKEKNTWIPKTNNFSIEEIFVYGIKEYYSKKA